MSNYVQSGEWELRAVLVERNLQYYPCCPVSIIFKIIEI